MQGPPLQLESDFPLLIQHHEARMPSTSHPEPHLKFPTSLGLPKALKDEAVLSEILKQWSAELNAESVSDTLAQEKARDWWNALNHAAILLTASINMFPCNSDSPKVTLVDKFVTLSVRPMLVPRMLEWLRIHNSLFPAPLQPLRAQAGQSSSSSQPRSAADSSSSSSQQQLPAPSQQAVVDLSAGPQIGQPVVVVPVLVVSAASPPPTSSIALNVGLPGTDLGPTSSTAASSSLSSPSLASPSAVSLSLNSSSLAQSTATSNQISQFVLSSEQFNALLAGAGKSAAVSKDEAEPVYQDEAVKFLKHMQSVVNARGYAELASMCLPRLNKLRQAASLPKARAKWVAGLEVVIPTRADVTTADMYNIDLCKSGSVQYLKLMASSSNPAVVAMLADCTKFFDEAWLLEYESGKVCAYVRAFLFRYCLEDNWVAKSESNSKLALRWLGNPVAPSHSTASSFRPTSPPRRRSPPARRVSSPDRRGNSRSHYSSKQGRSRSPENRGRGRDRVQDRGRDQGRSQGRDRDRAKRPDSSSKRPLKFCFSRVDPSQGECSYSNCKFLHECASCNNGDTHSAASCPNNFDVKKAKSNANRQ